MVRIDRALFLSLKPAYAELILSGEKTIELRRIRPRAEPGTLVVVYASTPVRAVLGTCTVESIRTEKPSVIWNLHAARTGVARRDFNDYFRGRATGVAIAVGRPRRLPIPISLDALREELACFAPPQSFRYLSPTQACRLIPDEWARHCAGETKRRSVAAV